MTDKASPYQAAGGPRQDADLMRFLRDWADLWRWEMRALLEDPDGMSAAMLGAMAKGGLTPDLAASMEAGRAAMVFWADVMEPAKGGTNGVSGADVAGSPPGPPAGAAVHSRDPAATPGAAAAVAAFDPRDAEIERLVRRVDELEARLSHLERPRRRGKAHI